MLSLVPDPIGARTIPGLGVSGVSCRTLPCAHRPRDGPGCDHGISSKFWAGKPSWGQKALVAPKGANQRTCLFLKSLLLCGGASALDHDNYVTSSWQLRKLSHRRSHL